MRKLLSASAVVLALGGITTSAHAAAYQTGSDYVTECAAHADWKNIACLTYARGIADGLTMWRNAEPDAAYACIPDEVESAQLRDVALRYIQDNPKNRHFAAGALIAGALVHNWPCAKPGEKVN